MKVMPRDEAFYYLHERGELIGAVLTHVDDFFMVINLRETGFNLLDGVYKSMKMV